VGQVRAGEDLASDGSSDWSETEFEDSTSHSSEDLASNGSSDWSVTEFEDSTSHSSSSKGSIPSDWSVTDCEDSASHGSSSQTFDMDGTGDSIEHYISSSSDNLSSSSE
jgi:hypothetical protein